MNIVILGATGKTGRPMLKQALELGHNVTVIVRNPNAMPNPPKNVRVIKGDAKDTPLLTKAFASQDAVMSVLGTSAKHADFQLMRESTRAIVTACEAAGVKRLIVMSTHLAADPAHMSAFSRVLSATFMKKLVVDVRGAEAIIRSSNLKWTIIYAATLTNKNRGKPARVIPPTEKLRTINTIARADVAAFMLANINNPQSFGKAIAVTGS